MSPTDPLTDEEKKWLLVLAHKKPSLSASMPRLVQIALMERGFALVANGVPRISAKGKTALLKVILR